MALKDLFNSRYKLPVQIVYIILVIAAMGISVPRMFMKNQPRTRANTIALGMGAKSLILIGYELLSEHVRKFHKWRSYKAYTIINLLEIVFWGAVIFLLIQANIKICNGIGCTLSWIVMGIAILLNQLAVYCFLVCYFEWRDFKHGRGHFEKTTTRDSQEMHLPSYVETSYKPTSEEVQPSYIPPRRY
ncbi:hypothetical protein Slin14017_G057090 [Septoria linicola]|nr:hypothetical protein Slin14017_G057090 [Septoria linicola]